MDVKIITVKCRQCNVDVECFTNSTVAKEKLCTECWTAFVMGEPAHAKA